MRIALVGVGLLGGSIGMAVRERLGARVRGFDPSGCGDAAEPCASVAEAVCDGPQALLTDDLLEFVEKVERAAAVAGKALSAV